MSLRLESAILKIIAHRSLQMFDTEGLNGESINGKFDGFPISCFFSDKIKQCV